MDRWIGHVALVTGSSSGIGKEIAVQLVEQGLKVVGFARRKELLEELESKLSSKKGKFYPYPGDASNEEDILQAFQWTKTNVGPVSIVINNAAILGAGKLLETETKVWQQQLDVNILAPSIISREAIKQMKESEIDGHIININSIAGQKVVQNLDMHFYSATKNALTALTERLRLDLAKQGSKIKVTSLSPGAVNTDMFNVDLVPTLNMPAIDVSKIEILEAVDIANAVLYVLSTPATVNISQLTIQAVGEKF